MSHIKPTPHGVRRGGATRHFGLYRGYDRTCDHGRWKQVHSAHMYIDRTMLWLGELDMSLAGKERMRAAVATFHRSLELSQSLVILSQSCQLIWFMSGLLGFRATWNFCRFVGGFTLTFVARVDKYKQT